jgi:DNA anti-recombination protein RmuC
MEYVSEISSLEPSLRTKLKLYKKRAEEIENYLSKKPEEWGKFQSEFNSEVNNVFRDIMNFEKLNFSSVVKKKFINLNESLSIELESFF